MQTGVISINDDVWDLYDNFEQNFIIFHELGHFRIPTDSETEADLYALQHVYKTAPKSLKRSLNTLYKIGILNSDRLWKLYQAALTLDMNDGNEAAEIELFNINNQNLNNMNAKGQVTYIKGNTNRADGGEETVEMTEITAKEPAKGHKKNGFAIGRVYFSITNILLMGIMVLLLVALPKIYKQ